MHHVLMTPQAFVIVMSRGGSSGCPHDAMQWSLAPSLRQLRSMRMHGSESMEAYGSWPGTFNYRVEDKASEIIAARL